MQRLKKTRAEYLDALRKSIRDLSDSQILNLRRTFESGSENKTKPTDLT